MALHHRKDARIRRQSYTGGRIDHWHLRVVGGVNLRRQMERPERLWTIWMFVTLVVVMDFRWKWPCRITTGAMAKL